MATYSLPALETRADCDAALGPLRLRRDEAAADVSALAFDLQTFSDPAARRAEITRLNGKISAGQAELLTLTEGREKRKLEDEVGSYTRRRNLLLNQSETRGGDDKVLLEFRLETARLTSDEATTLVAGIETHKAALPA
jgi:hypothetical protein